jgi:hypothetical protein
MHDDHAVGHFGDDAHVVRDQDHAGAEFALQIPHEVEDLRLHGHVERGRRLVGDQNPWPPGKRHGDHHTLAHAAGKLVRILLQPACCIGNADGVEQFERDLPRLTMSDRSMRADGLGQLAADREDRVERGERLLEDHADVAAAHAPHGGFRQDGKLAAGKRDGAAGDPRDVPRQEAHDR